MGYPFFSRHKGKKKCGIDTEVHMIRTAGGKHILLNIRIGNGPPLVMMTNELVVHTGVLPAVVYPFAASRRTMDDYYRRRDYDNGRRIDHDDRHSRRRGEYDDYKQVSRM